MTDEIYHIDRGYERLKEKHTQRVARDCGVPP